MGFFTEKVCHIAQKRSFEPLEGISEAFSRKTKRSLPMDFLVLNQYKWIADLVDDRVTQVDGILTDQMNGRTLMSN